MAYIRLGTVLHCPWFQASPRGLGMHSLPVGKDYCSLSKPVVTFKPDLLNGGEPPKWTVTL